MKTNTKRKSKMTTRKRVHHHVKMAVIPHKRNQFRPHMVRLHGIATVLVIVGSLVLGSNWLTSGSVLGSKANISVSELLASTNVERVSNNETRLQLSEKLSHAAFLKAEDMFARQYWAHDAPDGTKPWKWLSEVDYNYDYAGENLAKNFQSARSVVGAWMASGKHKDNVLGSQYTEVGFAVVDGVLNETNTTLIVALFGRPTEAIAGASTAPVENGAPVGGLSVMAQFGVVLQSVNPAVLSSVALLMSATIVALFAHGHRRQLPSAVRQTWLYHHGILKAGGLIAVIFVLVALYSGGQI